MSLFSLQVKVLDQGGFVVEVYCDLMIKIHIQRRRGLFALFDAELAAVEFPILSDDRALLRNVDDTAGVQRRVPEVPTARRAEKIEHLPVNGLDFEVQAAFHFVQVEGAGDAERAQRFVGLKETDGKIFHLRGRDIAVQFASFAGKAGE